MAKAVIVHLMKTKKYAQGEEEHIRRIVFRYILSFG